METLDALPAAIPRWINPTFLRTPGMNPLGLQSIAIDRIMPAAIHSSRRRRNVVAITSGAVQDCIQVMQVRRCPAAIA